MGKNNKFLKIAFTVFILISSFQISFSQNITEEDAKKKSDNYYETELKKLAEKITKEQKGININGVVLKGCYAEGKKLIWQYDVPSNWYPLENGKSAIIENFRKGGSSDLYYKNGISVEFQYFTNDKFSGFSFCYGEQDVIIIGFFTNDSINFPMAEFFTAVDGRRPFFNART